MFKTHEFTCEDVIYLQKRKQMALYTNVVLTVVGYAALLVYGHQLDKKERARYKTHSHK